MSCDAHPGDCSGVLLFSAGVWMVKKKKIDGETTVYKVRFVGTLNGEWEYDDDGGTYEQGSAPYELSDVYATQAAAEKACAELNNDYESMSAAVNAYDNEDTPFFAGDGDYDARNYSDRVALPWPQLWDKCLDLGIDPPIFTEDPVTKLKTRPEEEPDTDALASWWSDEVSGNDEVELELMKYITLPVLYEVFTQKIDAASRAELAKAFAANAGVPDSKRLQITLRDQNGNHVATYSGKAGEMIAKANEFLILHGTVQKDNGTVEFGPIQKRTEPRPKRPSRGK